MAKVKKAARVTGERNTTGKNAKSRKKVATKTAKGVAKRTRRSTTKTVKAKAKGKPKTKVKANAKAKKSGVQKRGLRVVRGRRVAVDAPVVTVAVKELDPLRKCGPKTTVQFLYRVDESVNGARTAHLVFFDRHGWYCEHGRTCPAVGHAKKVNGRIARVS